MTTCFDFLPRFFLSSSFPYAFSVSRLHNIPHNVVFGQTIKANALLPADLGRIQERLLVVSNPHFPKKREMLDNRKTHLRDLAHSSPSQAASILMVGGSILSNRYEVKDQGPPRRDSRKRTIDLASQGRRILSASWGPYFDSCRIW